MTSCWAHDAAKRPLIDDARAQVQAILVAQISSQRSNTTDTAVSHAGTSVVRRSVPSVAQKQKEGDAVEMTAMGDVNSTTVKCQNPIAVELRAGVNDVDVISVRAEQV